MDRSENMRRIKSRATKPEMAIRRLVYGMGYRYRLKKSGLPGRPDMVFSSLRKVIFIHGCFWHGHGCKRSHTPKSNLGYWSPKLARNKARDKVVGASLRKIGWMRLVLWECKIEKDIDSIHRQITTFLSINE